MTKQLCIFTVVCLFGLVFYEHAASQSGSKIMLPKITPIAAYIYFENKLNEEAYAKLNIPSRNSIERADIIANFKEKKERPNSVPHLFFQTYESVPTKIQSFQELLKEHYDIELLSAVIKASKSTGHSIHDLLYDKLTFDKTTDSVCANHNPKKLKLYCIVRTFQYIYKLSINADDFTTIEKEAEKVCDSAIAAVKNGAPTITLQPIHLQLEDLWNRISLPDLEHVRLALHASWCGLQQKYILEKGLVKESFLKEA